MPVYCNIYNYQRYKTNRTPKTIDKQKFNKTNQVARLLLEKGTKGDELCLEQFSMAATMVLESVPEQILIPSFLAVTFILDC